MAEEKKVTEVNNMSVRGFHSRINRFIYEMLYSNSSNGSMVDKFSKERLLSYLTALKNYHDFIMAEEPLDLPESFPKKYSLRPDVEIREVENEMVNDIVERFVLMRDEIIRSQSSRYSSGLHPKDSGRLLAAVANIDSYIKNYVDANVIPLDLPKSSPRTESIGKGRTGV